MITLFKHHFPFEILGENIGKKQNNNVSFGESQNVLTRYDASFLHLRASINNVYNTLKANNADSRPSYANPPRRIPLSRRWTIFRRFKVYYTRSAHPIIIITVHFHPLSTKSCGFFPKAHYPNLTVIIIVARAAINQSIVHITHLSFSSLSPAPPLSPPPL